MYPLVRGGIVSNVQMYHLIEHGKCFWDEHKFNPSLERTRVYWKAMHTNKWGFFY